jgi:hypothetical protein
MFGVMGPTDDLGREIPHNIEQNQSFFFAPRAIGQSPCRDKETTALQHGQE